MKPTVVGGLRAAEIVSRARQHVTEGGRVVSERLACAHEETLDLAASSHQGTR